jgi:hypothetical protein|tara:strand:- start:2433 stop:2582 length:150 start_codon:yes stop_codon:yes gene_type:complete
VSAQISDTENPERTPVVMPDKCFGMENNICTGDLVLLTIKEFVNGFLFK